MDETWLDPIEKKLGDFTHTLMYGKLPSGWMGKMTPEESNQFWNSLHDLLYRKYNPFNIDLPGNPKAPYPDTAP